MTGAAVLDLAREGIWVMILVAAPMMIVGLVVGVVIALFQALTQIQEMTLVFVPKILAIFVTMLLSLPFMGAILGGYMTKLADMIMSGG
ncbi:flagellar biosynthetic protein FliQ [Devosia sp. Root413D1]|jgi:flagellar biosynthetic protein FliQ|uniref:flagellar biosynthesis protein FliQ n=1 Tax=unclassified Devosia TaxID=196773 RepID=UPI000700AF1D|nr:MULTISPECIES: flagellar biosynthesis protein FliQ [unclassified Devosia]KQU96662.1 flagellar biosynthetic protein FliQ [Devosia sp. Root105]KQW77012.1 flagellar biosynthetic protein FliQ [Devosia sp. Root413D1]MDF2982827.1 flagellar biosynthetic protein FliQ [Devosia sp.]RYE48058.1 MAG: flagellar biosynthesis protein FliQ [Hyphomicrobiales bacterium]